VSKKKDLALEAIRGVAALVVVVWHTCMAFFPSYTGAFPPYEGQSWQVEPAFVFMNGPAAVALFFVLSGYVLSRRFFESGDHQILVKGALKRWPRLAGPVLLAVLASYALFKLNLYQFEQAGRASGSPWLVNFAHLDIYHEKPPIQFWSALWEGSILAFIRGDNYYNSVIWTMRPEFIGSLIVFGFAPIVFRVRKSSMLFSVGLVAISAILIRGANANLLAFPIGVGLAALIPGGANLPKAVAFGALMVALYLLGYSGSPTGFYAVFHPVLSFHADTSPSGIHVVGAALLIATVEMFPPIKRLFTGRTSKFLGDLSFPIYLVHVLVICSAGSAVYLLAGAWPAVFTVFICSILLSLPLIVWSNWWIAHVSAAADSTIKFFGSLFLQRKEKTN
jgi:peptidoglycan/LPS O-acetylase OafA/YrhL